MLQSVNIFLPVGPVTKNLLWAFTLGVLGLAGVGPAWAGVTEVDSNFDGQIDQWHHFAPDGQIEKVEYDLNLDGKVDQIQFFTSSKKLERIEFDTDHNGTFEQIQLGSLQWHDHVPRPGRPLFLG